MISRQNYALCMITTIVVLPLTGLIYLLLDLPSTETVLGVLLAVMLCLGIFLTSQSKKIAKARGEKIATEAREGMMIGVLEVNETTEGVSMSLNFPGDPYDIVNQDKVTFKVRKNE